MTVEELAAAGLRYDVDGAVATITLSRPDCATRRRRRCGGPSPAIGEGIGDDVRVVVVRGEGQTFSAGLDRAMLDPGRAGQETVAGLLALDDEAMSATIDDYQRGFTSCETHASCRSPRCRATPMGAGFQLALACDLRVLSEDAHFCMKESALGLVPDLTGTKPLVESVGYARALEICATARMVGAEEAVAIGLATTAVPAAELDAHRRRPGGGPHRRPMAGAVRETKALLQAAADADLDEQRRREREAQVRRFRELAARLADEAPAEAGARRGGRVSLTTGMGPAWRHMRTDREVVGQRRSRRGTVRRVLAFAGPHRRIIVVFLAVTVVDAALVVVNPLLVKRIVDDGIVAGRQPAGHRPRPGDGGGRARRRRCSPCSAAGSPR